MHEHVIQKSKVKLTLKAIGKINK